MGFWTVVEHVIREAHIVLFVLDARMPELSHNARLEEIVHRSGKHLVRVFTKIDLVSPATLQALQEISLCNTAP